MLNIIYQDESLVAINKPHGLLVHRSPIAADVSVFALQILRDQLGRYLYPIHRIDRKTSGVLLFAYTAEVAAKLQLELESFDTQKRYVAIVRGYFPDEAINERPLINDKDKLQEATTLFRCLKRTELPIAYGPYETSRYSLIEALPKTGRMHQIRKHLKQMRHPIIGDRSYGCNKQNKLFLQQWDMRRMMLHAESLTLKHPETGAPLIITADFQSEFLRMIDELKL